MLERLRDRGLISEDEYRERLGSGRGSIEASPGDVPGTPAAAEPEFAPVGASTVRQDESKPAAATPVVAPVAVAPTAPVRERYPMVFDVAYPSGMSRLSTLLRLVLLLPVYLFGTLLSYFVYVALFIGFTTVFWRRKYPDWLFRGLSGAFGWQARAGAYASLVSDQFPSFSREESPVTLEYDGPPSGHLSRWRVLFWKFVLLIPHMIVLSFISIAVFAVTVMAWFGILFTGNYPRGMFQFSVGVQRWWWRIAGYFAGFNDRFPPYALSADAGPASNGATATNGFIGAGAAAGFAALIGVAIAASNNHFTVEVDYARLESGQQQPAFRFKEDFGEDEVTLRLTRVIDPGNELIQVLRPASDERVVVFQWTVVNGTRDDAFIGDEAARFTFEYEDDDGEDARKSLGAALITVNNVVAPANVRERGTATVQAVFVVPEESEPVELRYRGGFSNGGVKYVFD
jgi:hypothetical protein